MLFVKAGEPDPSALSDCVHRGGNFKSTKISIISYWES